MREISHHYIPDPDGIVNGKTNFAAEDGPIDRLSASEASVESRSPEKRDFCCCCGFPA
jgi:hypothetical protein